MQITLSSSNKNNIKIINTYAPHMGYDKGGRIKYWEEINENMQNNNKKGCIIWCTDNNGQISNEGDTNLQARIGNRAISKRMKKIMELN